MNGKWKKQKTRNRTMRPRGSLVRIGMVLLLLFFVWCAYVQVRMFTDWKGAIPGKSDVGIVLGAALWNGLPSPGLQERLDRAVALYRQGRMQDIIVSGGYDYEGAAWTEAEGMQMYLVEQGIPEAHVHLENEATSTYENLLFSQAIMDRHGWQSALIITHHYHGARALDMARYLNYDEPHLATAPSHVLSMSKHRVRETLAFTKWQMDKTRWAWDRLLHQLMDRVRDH